MHRWTGVANCVGVGPTKTLAKLANKVAKHGAGVIDLSDQAQRAAALADYPIVDVWGIGSRWGAQLVAMNITTAAALRDAPPALILDRFGAVMLRTQRELQGIACAAIEETEADRQQIMVSRSFGERVEDHAAVSQAIASFATRAAEKLRRRGLVAGAVWIFANTDTFRPELRQHHPSRALTLAAATQDTRLILASAHRLLHNFLRAGCAYRRAGVALLDLARPADLQPDLFSPVLAGDPRLMLALDRINHRFGRGTAGFAASGWQARPSWGIRQRNVSPCYTTCPADFPRVQC